MTNSVYTELVRSLLTDIQDQTGVSLTPPDGFDLTKWVLSEGPLLDKLLLSALRSLPVIRGRLGIREDTPEMVEFMKSLPEWLTPLWYAIIESLQPGDNNGYYNVGSFGTSGAGMIKCLRQLLVFCYKVEHAPTKQQIQEAQTGFLEVEDGIRVWDTTFNSSAPGRYYSYARSLISRVLSKSTRDELLADITPAHGPGAVFPPCKPVFKSDFTKLYLSIDKFYPYDWFFPVFTEDLVSSLIQKRIEVVTEPILARMTAVPKDSRGPRLICVHPKEAIWIQQGQRRWLEDLIHKHPLTKGRISFRDQTGNGERARISSITQDFITLDLKEASDRISHKLFNYLFGGFEDILSCARAGHVQLMDGCVVELRKFAPMGNCLTFPVESLVFWALCTASICVDCGVKPANSDVYVFGDDIEYRPQYHAAVVARLVAAGLVPNASKTFAHGPFRESCGVDAFLGVDITPLRLRKSAPSSVLTGVAWCDLAFRARHHGLYHLSARLYCEVRKYHKVNYVNNENAVGLVEYVEEGFATFLDRLDSCGQRFRFNNDLHLFETECLLVKASLRRPLGTRWCVLDSLLKLEGSIRKNGKDDSSSYSPLRREAWRRLLENRGLDDESGPTATGRLAYADPDRIRLFTGWTVVHK